MFMQQKFSFALTAMFLICYPLYGSAKINFLKSDHDMGTISQGQVVEATFKFVNTGNSDLSILGTHASCGCTSVLENPDKVYKKGQAGTLRVQFDSKCFRGEITKTITVMTNEKAKPTRLLTVHGKVRVGIATYPEVLDFASVHLDNPKTLHLSVESHSSDLSGVKTSDFGQKMEAFCHTCRSDHSRPAQNQITAFRPSTCRHYRSADFPGRPIKLLCDTRPIAIRQG